MPTSQATFQELSSHSTVAPSGAPTAVVLVNPKSESPGASLWPQAAIGFAGTMVGAAVAITTAWMAATAQDRRDNAKAEHDARKEKAALLREKAERVLSLALSAQTTTDVYMTAALNRVISLVCDVPHESVEVPIDPSLKEASLLVKLYFPDADEEMDRIQRASHSLYSFTSTDVSFAHSNKVAWHKERGDTFWERAAPLRREERAAIDALAEKLAVHVALE
jgi:hypothetical protein